MEKEMVNHPPHYAKDGHTECIELMTEICSGYSGIAAFDIGQIKYNYRVGCKEDNGRSIQDKMVEDASKYLFYLQDFKKRAEKAGINEGKLPTGFFCEKNPNEDRRNFIAEEFIWDKVDSIKPFIYKVVKAVYCLKNIKELETAIEEQSKLVEELKKF